MRVRSVKGKRLDVDDVKKSSLVISDLSEQERVKSDGFVPAPSGTNKNKHKPKLSKSSTSKTSTSRKSASKNEQEEADDILKDL